MKAFQLLKSGASFSQQRIEKHKKLFKSEPNQAGKKSTKANQLQQDEDELRFIEIEKEIDTNKESTKEAQRAKNFDQVKKLQDEFVHLLNKRKESLIQLRKRHKITLEGTNLDSVPDLCASW